MTPKNILMAILMMSAVSLGLSGFFVGTATNYSASMGDMSGFSDTFNKYSVMDAKLKALQQSLVNIQVLNPITWNNVILLVLNFFSILFEIPGMIHVLVTDMIVSTGFLPAWVAFFAEGSALLLMVFGALAALKGGTA